MGITIQILLLFVSLSSTFGFPFSSVRNAKNLYPIEGRSRILSPTRTRDRCHYGTSSTSGITIRTSTSRIIVTKSFFNDALDNLFGGNKKEKDILPSSMTYPQLLLEIPVKEMKMGGLRFVLGLHLMGRRNQPEVGSWKVTQASDGVLDVIYMKDETASFSVTFLEKKIVVERWGTARQLPASLQYQLQESILLHSMLDELETLAYGKSSDNDDTNEEEEEEIKDSDRLLTLIEPGDAIEIARSKLPARSVNSSPASSA
jgi:hypothetical protein